MKSRAERQGGLDKEGNEEGDEEEILNVELWDFVLRYLFQSSSNPASRQIVLTYARVSLVCAVFLGRSRFIFFERMHMAELYRRVKDRSIDNIRALVSQKCVGANVTNLSLARASINDATLLWICRRLPNVRILSTAHCKHITDVSASRVGERWKLTSLSLEDCPNISSSGVTKAVARSVRTLESLCVSKLPYFHDRFLRSTFSRLLQLQRFEANGTGFSDGMLKILSAGCTPSLKYLDICSNEVRKA